ncbi:hypothetical protein NLI96_g1994 [Meripilus lineatus]|uniref:Methyltransferase type 11 domain-containing protein n=1 Tax=Meripilus lineatus TaxID=2056292 RepID=A0AAD5YHV0_9APHY|nr:hypothetical protein NLI96_g1994 [Physisporinus lineatus]
MSMTTKLPRLPQLRAPLKPSFRSYHPSRHLKNLASPLSASSQSHLNDIPPPASSSSSHSTVNEDEIAHFSRLSSLWWDERGEFGMLHKMNPVRMQFVREKLAEIAQEDAPPEAEIDSSKVLQGLNVLDVGCGGGLLSETLTRLGANTLGIDASSSNIAIASLHASQDPGYPSLHRLLMKLAHPLSPREYAKERENSDTNTRPSNPSSLTSDPPNSTSYVQWKSSNTSTTLEISSTVVHN